MATLDLVRNRDDLDTASAILVIECRLEEIGELFEVLSIARSIDDTDTDEQIALLVESQQLEEHVLTLRAMHSNEVISSGEPAECSSDSGERYVEDTQAGDAKDIAKVEDDDGDQQDDQSVYMTASTNLATPTTEDENLDSECVICNDMFQLTDVVEAPCNHYYCGNCIQDLFNASVKDESLFPPRCCRLPIPLDDAARYLEPEVLKKQHDKKVEMETLDRTYCSDPQCSAFIPPSSIVDNAAQCPTCEVITCVMCKASMHSGSDCPQDEETQSFLIFAKENGWQRCSSCRSMVSISTGCNHMRCRCNAQWCYRCGVDWKQCSCPQYTERLLMERANELADRTDDQRHPEDAATRRARVNVIARQLREHCDHQDDAWTFQHGAGLCENCSQNLPIFLFQCRRCGTQWCKRCTLNRT